MSEPGWGRRGLWACAHARTPPLGPCTPDSRGFHTSACFLWKRELEAGAVWGPPALSSQLNGASSGATSGLDTAFPRFLSDQRGRPSSQRLERAGPSHGAAWPPGVGVGWIHTSAGVWQLGDSFTQLHTWAASTTQPCHPESPPLSVFQAPGTGSGPPLPLVLAGGVTSHMHIHKHACRGVSH